MQEPIGAFTENARTTRVFMSPACTRTPEQQLDFNGAANAGQQMYDFVASEFPICRSITGEGVRRTLRDIGAVLPNLRLVEVPSGTTAFDWRVPDEWNIRAAWVKDEYGATVVDFDENNLHIVGYSEPVNATVTLEELNRHLHSLPVQPDAIPYVTSYYKRQWGLCMTHTERLQLKEGHYRVFIDSTLGPGSLTYGELILPGREEQEILLSAYVCHPSMANDSLSGVAVTTWLARWLESVPNRRYTYRIVFIPETIGSIVYLSRNLPTMRARTIAGFVITCCGDERTYSFLPSRSGNTLADKVALHVLSRHAPDFVRYSFLDRGSDERQYCSPGVDLPVVSVMRSKYREYPEYHTSLDDLALVTPNGLNGTYELMKKCLEALERNRHYRSTNFCEPQFGKRGLYPMLSVKGSIEPVRDMLNVLCYCDGDHDAVDIANIIHLPVATCCDILERLYKEGLVEPLETV
jgi:aminopeptidase-like protein